MTETLDYLRLIGGLVYLVLGGDLLVRGAISLARRFELPTLLVGLTIVALGTSLPELFICVNAVLQGFPGLAVGNVVGSNIANVLLVLGIPILITPTPTRESGVGFHAFFLVAISIAFIVLCFAGPLGLPHGLLMVSVLVTGAVMALRGHAILPGLDPQAPSAELERVLGLPHTLPMITLFIVSGLLALPLGSDLTVEGAVAIATHLGVAEAVIGSSIVAIGTSLPELGTTVMAAVHRSGGVVLGNVIGSNVLNILAIMGVTALVAPVAVPPELMVFDVWVMLAVAVLLWIYVLRAGTLGRASGIFFIVAYGAYLAVIYHR